jgi:hypothetical protein
VKCYSWSIALYGSETWALQSVAQKYLKVLKHGARERWRTSVGLIACEMKKCYIQSRRREISYTQQKGGRLTGLVTSCAGSAFYNILLKERWKGWEN